EAIFRFCVTVQDAIWDDTDNLWRIATSAGDVTARYLVSGAGGLSEPRLPDIRGIEDFRGEIFHSARWNHDVDLAGKRVAVIGTGASAIQIVPKVAALAGRLDVYQRTAPWVMPRHDREYTAVERLGLRYVPGLQKLYRTAIYWGRECYVPAFTLLPALATPVRLMAQKNIENGIADPELRQAVTPTFDIGCKRILISNTYYPALDQDNVELVTDGIREVTTSGIVTNDGTHREIDVLIVATGFHTTDQPIAHHIKGREGLTLADTWSEGGMAAYKGTTVSGFPNLFQIVGPNTGLGHSSMVFIIESQIAYIIDALRTAGEQGLAALEPRPDAQQKWNDGLQRRMKRTVWNSGGCSSWYLDEHGRNTILWPRTTFSFRALLRKFDADQYLTTKEHVA
ncbi:MAG: NAD(P)/FAD-dependent oxidoreductase, partial [Myxococcales bacterium]